MVHEARRILAPAAGARRLADPIETYKLGDVYHCTIANVDPGARFARADGPTREEAEAARSRRRRATSQQTRKFDVDAVKSRLTVMMPVVTPALALIIFAAGAAAGGLGALLGIGGGVFLVPLLNLGLGFPISAAAAISLRRSSRRRARCGGHEPAST